MNEQTVAEKKRNIPPRGGRGAKKMRPFTVAEKLRAVRLHLEEGFNLTLVCQELDVSKSSMGNWLKAYRLGGEAGLESYRGQGCISAYFFDAQRRGARMK